MNRRLNSGPGVAGCQLTLNPYFIYNKKFPKVKLFSLQKALEHTNLAIIHTVPGYGRTYLNRGIPADYASSVTRLAYPYFSLIHMSMISATKMRCRLQGAP